MLIKNYNSLAFGFSLFIIFVCKRIKDRLSIWVKPNTFKGLLVFRFLALLARVSILCCIKRTGRRKVHRVNSVSRNRGIGGFCEHEYDKSRYKVYPEGGRVAHPRTLLLNRWHMASRHHRDSRFAHHLSAAERHKKFKVHSFLCSLYLLAIVDHSPTMSLTDACRKSPIRVPSFSSFFYYHRCSISHDDRAHEGSVLIYPRIESILVCWFLKLATIFLIFPIYVLKDLRMNEASIIVPNFYDIIITDRYLIRNLQFYRFSKIWLCFWIIKI